MIALVPTDLTVYTPAVAPVHRDLILYIAVAQVPTYLTSFTSVAALVPTERIVCTSLATPIAHYVSL